MVARGLGRVYASTATPQARTRWDLDVAGTGPDGFVRRRRGFLELGCGFTRTLSTALRPSTHMMMASIPGAPLPDTVPSDALPLLQSRAMAQRPLQGDRGGQVRPPLGAQRARRRSSWRGGGAAWP